MTEKGFAEMLELKKNTKSYKEEGVVVSHDTAHGRRIGTFPVYSLRGFIN